MSRGPRNTMPKSGSLVPHTESNFCFKPRVLAYEQRIVDAISHWHIYHFQDTSPKAKVMGLCNIVDNQHLHGDAGNLAAILLKMRDGHREYYARSRENRAVSPPYFGDFVLNEASQSNTASLERAVF